MKYRDLRRVPSEGYDREIWQQFDDLYRGGQGFRKRLNRYLPQNDMEPAALYKKRLGRAHYINYSGPIGQFFAGMLFSSPFVTASDPEEAAQNYTDLKEDCDGQGCDLDAFMKARFEECLSKGAAYWRVDLAEQPTDEERASMSAADYEAGGYGRVSFKPIARENVTHWRRDDKGRFLWVVEYERTQGLLEFTDAEETITETWTLWTDADVRRWQVRYAKQNKPGDDAEIAMVPPPAHYGRIPIVEMKLPDSLWLMNHIGDAQLEHFRKECALSWGIERSCYAMPVFHLADKKNPPKMGAGYYIMVGKDEQVTYAAPPAEVFSVAEARLSALKDEIHRVATQMARGIDNNAAAIGRSAQSKEADNTAMEVVLRAMATVVCEALEHSYQLCSAARDEQVTWDVTNPATYDMADAAVLIQTLVEAMPLQIPSSEFMIYAMTKAALAITPDADEDTKKKIREQIRENFSAEEMKLRADAAAGLGPTNLGPAPPPSSIPRSTRPGDAKGGARSPASPATVPMPKPGGSMGGPMIK